MSPDDEILFGHVDDEIRSSYDRVQRLGGLRVAYQTSDLAVALAEFELHGATLRSLRRWYPDEERINAALATWELLSLHLASRGLPIEA